MYKRILIATDGSELADKAVATGLTLAKQLEASIVAVHVTEPWATDIAPELKNEPFLREYSGACANHAAKILGAVAARARAVGVDYIVRHIPDRYVADSILDAVAEFGCDLIVMASHGRRGIARFVMGSDANEVLVRSHLPVLICR